jgi:hypothetical protein
MPLTTMIRSWASTADSGDSSTACVQLKIVVFAPMPSARISTATPVNAGRRMNIRHANLRSCTIMRGLQWKARSCSACGRAPEARERRHTACATGPRDSPVSQCA